MVVHIVTCSACSKRECWQPEQVSGLSEGSYSTPSQHCDYSISRSVLKIPPLQLSADVPDL